MIVIKTEMLFSTGYTTSVDNGGSYNTRVIKGDPVAYMLCLSEKSVIQFCSCTLADMHLELFHSLALVLCTTGQKLGIS